MMTRGKSTGSTIGALSVKAELLVFLWQPKGILDYSFCDNNDCDNNNPVPLPVGGEGGV